jgi:UDP-N-acetylglucosamine--N-acetylmuramyl-(pentapeptide) pyrophosphoryl-undecaprenol N-acetylglucosamine transferase
MLQNLNRDTLLQRAQAAKAMEKTQATAAVAAACEELSA